MPVARPVRSLRTTPPTGAMVVEGHGRTATDGEVCAATASS